MGSKANARRSGVGPAKKLPAKAAYSKIRLSNLRQKKAYVIGDDPVEFVY